MKQTITIDIDVRDGYELKYNPETRTIEEVKKEPVRSMSWEEFCKNHPIEKNTEWCIDANRIIPAYAEITSRAATFEQAKGYLATKEDAEGILTLIQLTRLHDEWVGDWEPDYKGKWFCSISYYQNYIDVLDNRYQHVLLSFPTKEMAKDFLECFKDLIEKAKRFI